MTMKNIEVLDPPIAGNLFQFLFEHLDCNCIADIPDLDNTEQVSILAYAKTQAGNRDLEKYYYSMKLNTKYKLVMGIDSRMVNSIG